MRFSLLFAFLLSIGAIVFALQNPGYTDLKFGPYDVHASTALILMVAIAVGAIIGSLAMLPGRLKKKKEVKNLKKSLQEA